MKKWMHIGWVIALTVLWAGTTAWAVPYVITSAGERIEGTAIRARADGEIVLSVPGGTRSFVKGQYTKAVADKPAQIDQARALFAQGKYDEAIRLLEPIVRDLKFLSWDLQALILIGQAQSKKGNAAGAADAFEKLIQSPGSEELPSDVHWAYRQSLLAAGRTDKLLKILDGLIGKDNSADAARALVLRGDLRASQNQLEPAVLDYLRTVVFYQDEPCRAEAMYKAAETLAKMRDARAKDWYRQVITEYPESPYATQAKGKV